MVNIFIIKERAVEFLTIVKDVGFPIASAIAAGYFVFLSVKFILDGVRDSVSTLKNIVSALDNRVQTMNNDLVKIDVLLSYVLNVKPNIDRIAANEGKNDARRD
jgi:archaellum biogenesis ATPase FlaH